MGGADKRTRWRRPTLGRHRCVLWAGEYVSRRGEGGRRETRGGRTDSVQVDGSARKRQYPGLIFGGTWRRRTGGPWRAFSGGGCGGRGRDSGQRGEGGSFFVCQSRSCEISEHVFKESQEIGVSETSHGVM